MSNISIAGKSGSLALSTNPATTRFVLVPIIVQTPPNVAANAIGINNFDGLMVVFLQISSTTGMPARLQSQPLGHDSAGDGHGAHLAPGSHGTRWQPGMRVVIASCRKELTSTRGNAATAHRRQSQFVVGHGRALAVGPADSGVPFLVGRVGRLVKAHSGASGTAAFGVLCSLGLLSDSIARRACRDRRIERSGWYGGTRRSSVISLPLGAVSWGAKIMWTTEILVMLAMIGINSFFAAYEIALASITLSRLHVLVKEGRKGARAALYMKENMEGSLAVVQLGITLVGAIAAATGGAARKNRLSPLLQNSLGISEGLAD